MDFWFGVQEKTDLNQIKCIVDPYFHPFPF